MVLINRPSNFPTDEKDLVSDVSDSELDEDTVFMQESSDLEEYYEPTDSVTWDFGRSVGAELQQLTELQRFIAQKLISDLIQRGKMGQLSEETTLGNLDEPSRYDPGLDNGGTKSSSSCQPAEASEDRRKIEKTQNAVNCNKTESDEKFHGDEEELKNLMFDVKE